MQITLSLTAGQARTLRALLAGTPRLRPVYLELAAKLDAEARAIARVRQCEEFEP